MSYYAIAEGDVDYEDQVHYSIASLTIDLFTSAHASAVRDPLTQRYGLRMRQSSASRVDTVAQGFSLSAHVLVLLFAIFIAVRVRWELHGAAGHDALPVE